MQGMTQGVAATHAARRKGARAWQALCLFLLVSLLSGIALAQVPPPPPLPERQGNVAYLLRATQQQVLRYDLAQRQWLTPIAIDAAATAFTSTPTHLYIAYGRRIERRTLTGGDATHVMNVSGDVEQLLADGNLLFVMHPAANGYGTIVSVALGSLTRVDDIEHYYDFGGAVLDRVNSNIFSLRPQTSPNEIRRIAYTSGGQLGPTVESPYHGNYALGQRLWMYPDGSRVISAGGNIFHAEDLTHALAFDGEITDVAFLGNDIPLVLADDRVSAYDNALRRTGDRALVRPAFALSLHGGQVFVFQESPGTAGAVVVEHFALSELSPAEPGQAISPLGLVYTIDDAAVDANGVAYLLSNAYRSVFRWDIAAQRYLGTLPLSGPARDIEIADRSRRLYVLDGYGRSPDALQGIAFFDLAQSAPQPQAFAMAPVPYLERVVAMETELVLMDNYQLAVFSRDGVRIATVDQCCYSGLQFYDAAHRYLYVGNSRRQYLGNGQFAAPWEPGEGYADPLGISRDGRVLVDASGVVYDSATRRQVDALSNDVVRARWTTDNTLFTTRPPQNLGSPWEPEYANLTTVQRWGARYALERELTLDGRFAETLVHGQHLLVITYLDGTPSFTRLDRDLQVVAPDALAAPLLLTDGYSATAVALRWSDVAGEASYVVERQDPGTPTWRAVQTMPANRVRHIDLTLEENGVFRYRVIARNGARSSAPSNVVEIDLTGSDGSGALPGGTDFVADDALLAGDGRLYLLSREHEQLFVWSTRHQRWEPSIKLLDAPHAIAYSESGQALYVQYEDGGVTALNLRARTPREVAFFDGGEPCGILGVDTGLLHCADDTGWWYGAMLQSLDVVGRSKGTSQRGGTLALSTWNAATGTAWHGGIPAYADALNTVALLDDGTLDTSGARSYTVNGAGTGFHVDPSGRIVVIGTGAVISIVDSYLDNEGQLPAPVTDAVWRNGVLHTVHGNLLDAHDDYNSTRPVATLPAPAKALFLLPQDRLLAVMVEDEARMRFTVYDAADVAVPEPVLSDGFE